MHPQSYYKILQVDSAASPEVIEAAYKRLARIHHPDLNSAPDALRTMQDINEAYDILRDPIRRGRYDESLRNASESAQTRARSSSQTQTRQASAQEPPMRPPACQSCGKIDPTLRIALFPYVISIFVLTFRRSWSGVYCRDCRSNEMFKAKITSLFLGWWGIPFGPIFTLGNLFRSGQGVIPAEANSQFLYTLGSYFVQTGQSEAARRSFSASYGYVKDPMLRQTYKSVFGSEPDAAESRDGGNAKGLLFGLVAIGLIVFFVFILPGSLSSGSRGGTTTSRMEPAPSSTPTPDPTSTVAIGTSSASSNNLQNSLEQRTPGAGSLFTLEAPPTPAPRSVVMKTSDGYDWIPYANEAVEFLHPNGWWTDIDLTDEHISIRGDGVWLDVNWVELDDDISWAFNGDNRHSTVFQDMAAEIDESYIESLLTFAPATDVSQFDQTAIGNFPTISNSVYELVLDGNWTDTDELMVAGGVVLCGPQRVCNITYHLADRTFTVDDWSFLDTFARSLSFVGDRPLPSKILTPQPTPEKQPKQLKPPSLYSRYKASKAVEPTVAPTP